MHMVMLLILQTLRARLQRLTHMMLLVLRRILTRMTQMLSVTVVNTTIPKLRRFIYGQDTTIRVQVDLSAVIHSQEEELIRLV